MYIDTDHIHVLFQCLSVYILSWLELHVGSKYRNAFYFCGFHRCVNTRESLTNWVKSGVLYVCKWFTGVNTPIKSEKIIHSLQFQLCHQNHIFVDIIAHFKSWRKENSFKTHAHGIYWSVKLFLQGRPWKIVCLLFTDQPIILLPTQ